MRKQPNRSRPLLFGPSGRELFGMLHQSGSSMRGAVLLCPPFGQEAIRAHRTFKVLADRLARAGHLALRFDYYGCGDSDGADDDVTLSGLSSDIVVADATLRQLAAGFPVTWLGLGLGATAAWMAAASSAQKPDQLLLWDPVLDGPRYLALLRQRHGEFVGEAFSLRRDIPRESTMRVEACGYAIAPAFETELGAVGVEALALLPAGIRATLVSPPGDADCARIVRRTRASGRMVRHVEVQHDFEWLVETIDNGSLVPAKAVQTLVSLTGDLA